MRTVEKRALYHFLRSGSPYRVLAKAGFGIAHGVKAVGGEDLTEALKNARPLTLVHLTRRGSIEIVPGAHKADKANEAEKADKLVLDGESDGNESGKADSGDGSGVDAGGSAPAGDGSGDDDALAPLKALGPNAYSKTIQAALEEVGIDYPKQADRKELMEIVARILGESK